MARHSAHQARTGPTTESASGDDAPATGIPAADLLRRYRSTHAPERAAPAEFARADTSETRPVTLTPRPTTPAVPVGTAGTAGRTAGARAVQRRLTPETAIGVRSLAHLRPTGAMSAPAGHRVVPPNTAKPGTRVVARSLLATTAVVGVVGGTELLAHPAHPRTAAAPAVAQAVPAVATAPPALAAIPAPTVVVTSAPATAAPATSAAAGTSASVPTAAPHTTLSAAVARAQVADQRLSRDQRRSITVPGKTVPGTWILPTHGRYTSCFCARWGRMHEGIDLAAPLGTPIYAVGDGTVIKAGSASGFGQWVVVQHSNGDVSIYGHMRYFYVKVGDKVTAGEKIALVGAEGDSTGPHLHFEVHKGGMNGTKIDPIPWLRARGISVGPYIGN